MKKILLVLPIVLLVAAACNSSSTSNSGASSSSGGTSSAVKFSDQSYFKNAYLISSNTLSADAQKALTGFQMTKKTLADGSIQINLNALEANYHNQQYVLEPGQQLYFIEKFLGDDQAEKDQTAADDSAVVVDSNGNVVQAPQGF